MSRKLSSGLYCVRELGSLLYIYIEREREREREIMRHQFFIRNLKRVKCNRVTNLSLEGHNLDLEITYSKEGYNGFN